MQLMVWFIKSKLIRKHCAAAMDLLPKDLSVPVRSCQARQKKKNQDKTLFLCLFPVCCFKFTEGNEGKNILPSYHQLDCLKCWDSCCSKLSTDRDAMSSEMTHEIKFNCQWTFWKSSCVQLSWREQLHFSNPWVVFVQSGAASKFVCGRRSVCWQCVLTSHDAPVDTCDYKALQIQLEKLFISHR